MSVARRFLDAGDIANMSQDMLRAFQRVLSDSTGRGLFRNISEHNELVYKLIFLMQVGGGPRRASSWQLVSDIFDVLEEIRDAGVIGWRRYVDDLGNKGWGRNVEIALDELEFIYRRRNGIAEVQLQRTIPHPVSGRPFEVKGADVRTKATPGNPARIIELKKYDWSSPFYSDPAQFGDSVRSVVRQIQQRANDFPNHGLEIRFRDLTNAPPAYIAAIRNRATNQGLTVRIIDWDAPL